MSTIRVVNQASAPTTPGTGETTIYVDTTNKQLASKDDAGVVTTYGSPTDPDAIHDNVSGEIAAVTEKATPVNADLLLIEDSAAANAKKRVQIGNLPATDTDAIHDNVAAEISAVTEKTTPVSADLVLIEDSADSNNKKRVQVGNLPNSGDLQVRSFYPDMLDFPNGSDWPVTALAGLTQDSNNAGLSVVRFDDSSEEACGWDDRIPTGKTNVVFRFQSRRETSGTAQNVVPRVYVREMPDNAAVEAWSAGTDLTALAMPADEDWQDDEQTVALTTLSLVAGRRVQYCITRNTAAGGDTLSGDWTVNEFQVEYT